MVSHTSRLRAVFMLFMLIGCLSGWTSKGIYMSKKLDAMPMRTVCFGRFLLDIPASAEISLGGARIGGWDVSAPIDETEEEFNRRLERRQEELQGMKNRQLLPTLEATKSIGKDGLSGKTFMFDRLKTSYIQYGKRVEEEGVSFQSMIHSRGRSFELMADLRSEDQLARKARIASQFERWSFNQLPKEPGFCMGEAFVHEPLSVEDGEFVMMYIGMKNHPDLAIAISTWAGMNLNAPLLERDSNSSIKQEYASRFKDLGRGERTINGIKGGQIADEVVELNGTVAYSFQWESVLEKNSVLRPRILLELDTGNGRPGGPVNSSLSKRDVLKLWDRISSSIRERPENIAVAGNARHDHKVDNEK